MWLHLPALLWATLLAAEGPSLTQDAAERLARSRYFGFELAPVETTFAGDWARFLRWKEAEEAAAPPVTSRLGPLTAEEQRARRALQAEFELVARPRKQEILALARKVLEAARRGRLEPLAEDCTMYDAAAPDRRALTLQYLREQESRWRKVAAAVRPDAALELWFEAPSPSTGMPGKVHVAFGPEVPDRGGLRRQPGRDEVELWWSGEVMPEANGPVHAAPSAAPPPSRWRFHAIVPARSLQVGLPL